MPFKSCFDIFLMHITNSTVRFDMELPDGCIVSHVKTRLSEYTKNRTWVREKVKNCKYCFSVKIQVFYEILYAR